MPAAVADVVALDVDLNAHVGCAYPDDACAQPGTWVETRSCCRRNRTLCLAHADELERRWDEWAETARLVRTAVVVCAWCDTKPMPRPTWRPL
ncbi:hypothetical protein [Xylanimonas oleitrophica]|nr:hypothetical protein [Xylanimonas oleitrophica]